MLFPGQLQWERGDWRCRDLPMVFPLFPKLRLFEGTFLMAKYFSWFEIEQKHPGHVSPSGSSGQQPDLEQVVLGLCLGIALGPSQLPDSCQPRARAVPACAMGTRSSGYVLACWGSGGGMGCWGGRMGRGSCRAPLCLCWGCRVGLSSGRSLHFLEQIITPFWGGRAHHLRTNCL